MTPSVYVPIMVAGLVLFGSLITGLIAYLTTRGNAVFTEGTALRGEYVRRIDTLEKNLRDDENRREERNAKLEDLRRENDNLSNQNGDLTRRLDAIEVNHRGEMTKLRLDLETEQHLTDRLRGEIADLRERLSAYDDFRQHHRGPIGD